MNARPRLAQSRAIGRETGAPHSEHLPDTVPLRSYPQFPHVVPRDAERDLFHRYSMLNEKQKIAERTDDELVSRRMMSPPSLPPTGRGSAHTVLYSQNIVVIAIAVEKITICLFGILDRNATETGMNPNTEPNNPQIIISFALSSRQMKELAINVRKTAGIQHIPAIIMRVSAHFRYWAIVFNAVRSLLRPRSGRSFCQHQCYRARPPCQCRRDHPAILSRRFR